MRGLIGRARAFLTAKTPAEQLDEVRAKIREASAEVARLDDEIAQLALPILRGDTEAARVAVDLEREKIAGAGEIATMRTAEAQLAATVAAEERAEAHAAAARLPRQVAEEAERLLELDDRIHELADALAAGIRERRAAGLSLAEAVGSTQLRNINVAIASRVRDAIARYFQIDRASGSADRNDLLLTSNLRGPRAEMTLRQQDCELLDDECPYFLSQEAAGAAAARLAARNTKTVAHPLPDGCFTLIRTDDLFIDRSAADAAVKMAAKVDFALTVTPYRGGWLVRPPRAPDAVLSIADAA